MITGANSGIGKATAQEIASRGGTIHMVCRNEGRAEAAKEEIVERSTYILTTALIPALKKVEDPRVVTVSSGGMLTQKLNVDDLQFEKGTFDGTMVYAQNKRQQVILTDRWASQHKEIHFSCMHPGWADTPGRDRILD
ncbi:hypothetical protein F7725_002432 [Dissostichus mawsoni]|uniref:Dehydrogenase/reductase SDR family member 12 n=1 Tax=Dissostichus mawsoni TaxID=36200 RepID=A0A7J5Y3D5_DISMA|nr:hypothetical protein F7725_002432 [Dissostichus mawsoni]